MGSEMCIRDRLYTRGGQEKAVAGAKAVRKLTADLIHVGVQPSSLVVDVPDATPELRDAE